MQTGEIISMLALGVSFVVMALAFRRDTRGGGAELGEIRAKLSSISGGIDDIRVEVRTMREKQQDMAVRLAEAEASCKSMHKRLDEHIERQHRGETE